MLCGHWQIHHRGDQLLICCSINLATLCQTSAQDNLEQEVFDSISNNLSSLVQDVTSRPVTWQNFIALRRGGRSVNAKSKRFSRNSEGSSVDVRAGLICCQ